MLTGPSENRMTRPGEDHAVGQKGAEEKEACPTERS